MLKLINEWYESLCEMAYDRKRILHDLSANEDYRLEHLVKIFLFNSDSDNFNHWCSEVYRACHKTQRWNKNNKFLNYDDIAQELWYGWEDCYYDWIDNIVKDVCRVENKLIPKYDKEQLYKFLENYHLWLAEKLSQYGVISFDECKDILLKLISNVEN